MKQFPGSDYLRVLTRPNFGLAMLKARPWNVMNQPLEGISK